MNLRDSEDAGAVPGDTSQALAPLELVPSPAGDGQGAALRIQESAACPPLPSRDRVTRRLAARIYETCPWLQASDAYGVVRFAHLHRLATTLALRLQRRGVIARDGSPKKALDALVRLSAEMRSLEYSLGLSFTSRVDAGLSLSWTQAALISVGGQEAKPVEELSDGALIAYHMSLKAEAAQDADAGNVTPEPLPPLGGRMEDGDE